MIDEHGESFRAVIHNVRVLLGQFAWRLDFRGISDDRLVNISAEAATIAADMSKLQMRIKVEQQSRRERGL